VGGAGRPGAPRHRRRSRRPPCSVGELAVDQALEVLKQAGLLSQRAAGTRRIYRLDPTAVAALPD
jgi:DNA-binding transcriptional ArsR family regulator